MSFFPLMGTKSLDSKKYSTFPSPEMFLGSEGERTPVTWTLENNPRRWSQEKDTFKTLSHHLRREADEVCPN